MKEKQGSNIPFTHILGSEIVSIKLKDFNKKKIRKLLRKHKLDFKYSFTHSFYFSIKMGDKYYSMRVSDHPTGDLTVKTIHLNTVEDLEDFIGYDYETI